MELVYLWVEDYKNIKRQGFNFSPRLTQKTEEEVKQDLFGEYLFEDDNLHKRPLSKLTRDISKELGLI